MLSFVFKVFFKIIFLFKINQKKKISGKKYYFKSLRVKIVIKTNFDQKIVVPPIQIHNDKNFNKML